MEEVHFHFPHDVLLNHILLRVPPKSIGRFRCVSKEWHSSLASDMFLKKHTNRHQNNIKLLVFSKTETSSFQFTTIDCDAPPTDEGLTPTRRPLPLFGDTAPPHDIRILTSFHGLVCLGIKKDRRVSDRYCDLILWNPLTNEYKRLSKSNSDGYCNTAGTYSKFQLYYSSCEDDYKLLFVNSYAYIYSLKSDSWRRLDSIQKTDILSHRGCWSRGTYLNENLYFLKHHKYSEKVISFIRFDIKTEQLSTIETPNIYFAYDLSANIVVKSDCIHVCVKYDTRIHGYGWRTCIKLWKLDGYENLKEVLTYQVRPLLDDGCHSPITPLCPFYLMKNGNWLMIKNKYQWWFNENKIYKVDLEKSKRDFEYVEEVRMDGDKNTVLEEVLEEGRYIETFVSPNRYMK